MTTEKITLDDSSLDALNKLKGGIPNFYSSWETSIIFRYLIATNSIYKYIKKINIRILDVGGSVGNFINFFTRFYQTPARKKIDKYTNVELDDNFIKVFNKKFDDEKFKNYEIIKKDLTNIDVKFDNKYDVIICMEILEHLGKESAKQMLKVLYNNLNDNGIIVISSPNPKKENGQNFIWPENHIYEFTLDEMKNLLYENNLCILNIFGWCGKANNMKKKFNDIQDFLYNKFNKAFGSGMSTSLIATLYPELAECYIFICKK
jgi:2-polyprenyl-3-methyl-5-hydroxy-6-metoxy-1,4-benzoquinol methylase